MENEYSKFFCLFIIFVSAVMLGVTEIGFTYIFFWLNIENNADPYVIKHPSLTSTRKYDNEPHGTLFS